MRIQDYQTNFQVHYWTQTSSGAVGTTQIPNDLIANISFSFGFDVDRGIWPRVRPGMFTITFERNTNTVTQSYDTVWDSLRAMSLGTGFSFKWNSSISGWVWYGPNWYLDTKSYSRDEFGNETLTMSMVDVWTKITNTIFSDGTSIVQQTCYARFNYILGRVNNYYTNFFRINLASYTGHSIKKAAVPSGYNHVQAGTLIDNVLETDLAWPEYWAPGTEPGVNYIDYKGRGDITAFPAPKTTNLYQWFSTQHSTSTVHYCIEECQVTTDTTGIVSAMRIALASDDTKTYYWSDANYIKQFGQNYLDYALDAVDQTDVNRFGTSIATTQDPRRVSLIRTRLYEPTTGVAKELTALKPGVIVNVYDDKARDTINEWHRINAVTVNISQNEMTAEFSLYKGNISGEGTN